ncbi:CshA/CshB family fibrillar adhesin-related protein [Arcanobacterium buesumense]|uniref:Prealbumin-like fold domain-containing protein n=1 Tax=Arcanobacterium buesumense TaxID=2722751 RepID=A0A6H2EK70_9ACTO|nr:CshA/CshB family fibrillar adhesin-related protein [Arcanobacterium buesumense]QJC21259.1 hypothetical protein HC352_01145 [Arcanobacterium buesumense]
MVKVKRLAKNTGRRYLLFPKHGRLSNEKSTRLANRRTWLGCWLTLAVLSTVFTIVPTTLPSAYALYGDGGSSAEHNSPYVGMIDWVDWSQPASEEDAQTLEASGTGVFNNDRGTVNWSRQDAGTIRGKGIHTPKKDGSVGYQVRSKTEMGASTIETTCTLQNFYEDADKRKASNNAWLNIHIPGAYTKDGWDDVYSSFNEKQKVGLPVGIGRTANSRARFDISCYAQIRRPQIGSGSEELVDLPIKGLVFADAESMSLREYSYITPAKIDSNKPVTWHLLEQHKADGDTTTTAIDTSEQDQLYQYSGLKDRLDTAHPLKFSVADYETKADFSQVTTFYASNANGAYIDLRGRPGNILPNLQYLGNYLAIGVVIGADLGDGPESYGQAGAIVQPEVTDNIITGSTTASDQPTATVKEAGPPFLGSRGPDLDTQFVRGKDGKSKARWNPLIGDDRNNSTSSANQFNDEDAFDQPLLVSAQPGKVEQIVACVPAQKGTTTVSGWLDWNANGTFEDTERANGECRGKQASLVWDVKEQMLPAADKPNAAPSLLRLIATTESPESFTFNSMVIGGEVEDHAVTLVRPNLTVTKHIVGSDGVVNPAGVLAGFPFTATGSGLTVATPEQTTKNDGNVSWPLIFDQPATGKRPLLIPDGIQGDVADVTVHEGSTPGYTPYSVQKCSSAVKPDWVEQVVNNRQEQVYAWPAVQEYDVVLKDGSFTLPMTPTSMVSCAVNNQPYGQIAVTPTVESTELEPGVVIDPQLEFQGKYTCTAPQAGPLSGGGTVTGTWGPIKAHEVWTSQADKDRIIAGSSCTIQQDSPTKMPVAGNAQYIWKDRVDYQVDGTEGATIVAQAGAVGETIHKVTVVNTVERVKATDVRWTKVDEGNRSLTGAVFELRSSVDPTQSIQNISDCTSEPCTGPDKDPQAGVYKLTDILLGSYQLTETEAPAGFTKLEAPITFTVAAKDLANGKDLGSIKNTKITASFLPSLPMSGGMSTVIFTMFGLGTVALAVLLGVIAFRKKVRSS